MKKIKFYFLFFIVLTAFALQVQASSIIGLNLQQLTKAAQTVVYGTVTDVRTVEENNKLVIYTTLSVHDILKGTFSDQDYVFSQIAPHTSAFQNATTQPSLSKGKSYILFMPPQSDSTVQPIGGAQGVFEVQNDVVKQLNQHKSNLAKNIHLSDSTKEKAVLEFLNTQNADVSYMSFADVIKILSQTL